MSKVARVYSIHMASDEYGSPLMRDLAAQKLRELGGAIEIVEVWEHGGWWLSFAIISANLHIVASANGQAYYPKEVGEWRKQFSDFQYVCEDRRQARQVVTNLLSKDWSPNEKQPSPIQVAAQPS